MTRERIRSIWNPIKNRKDTIMKRKKYMVLAFAVVCCMVTVGVSGLTMAAASGAASVGDFSTDDGRVVFHSGDIAYLSGELDALHSEIDDSVFNGDSVNGIISAPESKRRNMITSRGVINYNNGKVSANAANLFTLADRTDALANAYTAAVCRALNDIGTYFDADGNVNHESQTAESVALSCAHLAEGILRSQSVDHLPAAPVIADNLTAGTAAWVNGQCVIGNGADNERAYQRGFEDGESENDDDIDIEYTRHVHRNGNGEEVTKKTVYASKNPGGCYRANGHTHDAVGTCPKDTVECSGSGGAIDHHPSCIDSGSGWGTDNEHIHCKAKCQVCGREVEDAYAKCTYTTTSYVCSQSTNTWQIGCGKNAGQIESVKIIIRKKNGAEE